MLQEGRTEERSKGKRRKGESCWMDHDFLCPSGLYSVDEALVIAVDARVLMDMPDADEKKCSFSRRRLWRDEGYLGVSTSVDRR